MNADTVVKLLSALMGLAGEVLEASARKGTDPVDAIEALRTSVRKGIEESVQAELDARFSK